MGPALAANCGSGGNAQLRWVQGLMASSCSQRQIVIEGIAKGPASSASHHMTFVVPPST